jgi:dienelactone hydrolase
MGTIILIVAFLIEIAFTTYCMITKSNQEKVRSYLRISAFAAFFVFTLVSIIQWSFRWYLLAVLLLVWMVLGVWVLIRKKVDKKEFTGGRTVFKAIGTLLLVFLVTLPILIFPQHLPPKVTGKHPVATALFTYINEDQVETLTNTGEKRKVNVEFWYPADSTGDEKYPLVIFSHGSMGMKTSNASTFLDLASNGYVVCSIDFPYLSLFTRSSDGHLNLQAPSFRQELFDVNNGKYDEATELQLEHKWMGLETTGINFVLDTILASAQDSSSAAVYQLVDGEKIGLMGHSLGGEASAQVARERFASGQNDIGAVVNLDADLAGEYLEVVNGKEVLNNSPYPVPILTILSDELERRINAIPNATDVVAVKHIDATSPQAYEIHFAGTNHMSFTDLAVMSPLLTSLLNGSVHSAAGSDLDPLVTIEKLNDTVLRFFNVFLKGDGNFSTAGLN